MARNGAKTGRYDLRVVILRRELGTAGDNGEVPQTWPDPAAGTGEYFASRDTLNAGETITQGINQSVGGMKLRIKGRAIEVSVQDRVRKKYTGETFEVTGVMRESADTIIMCERVQPQTTGQ